MTSNAGDIQWAASISGGIAVRGAFAGCGCQFDATGGQVVACDQHPNSQMESLPDGTFLLVPAPSEETDTDDD